VAIFQIRTLIGVTQCMGMNMNKSQQMLQNLLVIVLLIDWYSKQQEIVETAMLGSDFTVARIAVDQIIDIRTTLRYLGVPVNAKSFMFGDNQAVVTKFNSPFFIKQKA
jgi:hypothetical protein